MTTPSVFIGFLIASSCGFLYHFIKGGGLSRLFLYVATSWVSFFVGHFVGEWTQWRLWRFGTLNLFPALFATILGLMLASILAGPENPSK
jgi:hypothetical protein